MSFDRVQNVTLSARDYRQMAWLDRVVPAPSQVAPVCFASALRERCFRGRMLSLELDQQESEVVCRRNGVFPSLQVRRGQDGSGTSLRDKQATIEKGASVGVRTSKKRYTSRLEGTRT